jgi:hypothetical protein
MSGCLSVLAAAAVSACGGGTGVISTDDLLNASTSGQGDLTSLGTGRSPMVQIAASKRISDVASYVTIAEEGQSFTLSSTETVRYGAGSKWTSKVVTGAGECTDAFFGNQRMTGISMQCQIAAKGPSLTAPVPVLAAEPAPAPAPTAVSDITVAAASSTPTSTTPQAIAHGGIAVDTTTLPVAQPGVSSVLLSAPGSIPPAPAPGEWETDGAFRLICNWSKMSYDDPIVYPNQPGAAHHHTFFGNTAIDASTTSENIRSKGNASCRGGTINLSGYWVPSMIDTATGKPIAPKVLLIYYKTGFWTYFNDGSVIQPIPKGLKMIAGDGGRSTAGGVGNFGCMMPAAGSDRAGTTGSAIPKNCQPGDELWARVQFPQCWDGVNLDSPDHKSHMSYPITYWTGDPLRQYRCPATHPVVLPAITFAVEYTLPADANTSKWRLASDTYDSSTPAGYSMHGDWMNGWDPTISELWGIKCMRERRNCGSANLGDGRTTLEFQGN